MSSFANRSGSNRSGSMQRIIPNISMESQRSKSNYSNDLDSIGKFVATATDSDSDIDSVASESRCSVTSTTPSETNRTGRSDRRVVGTLMRRVSSRVSANSILEKFGYDYLNTLPAELQHQCTSSSDFPVPRQQRYTGAELGSIQDVLVRYESKAYDLLSRGRHDRALQTCKQLRALIRRLANEGHVSDHHGSVAGAGHGDGNGTSILLKLYAMAVESEAYFLNGKLQRAKKRLLEMDAALAKLSTATDQPLSQLPRAVRCGVACYTMLGNLFSVEARRMRLNDAPDEKYQSTLDLSVEAFRHAVRLRKVEGGNSSFGHTLLGEVLVVQGNFVEATCEFQQALDCALRFGTGAEEHREPGVVQERRNLGDALLIRNNYAASLKQYTACVRAMSANCRNLIPGCSAWRSEMLAQAAVCSTISSCLRALGQLDQAHAILDEAEKLVLESGALDEPRDVLRSTSSQISMTTRTTPNKNEHKISHTASPSSSNRSPLLSMQREKGGVSPNSRSSAQDESESRRMRMMASAGISTTGEASLELLIRIEVERGHTFIRGGEWKAALKAYQSAETKLDVTADNGLQVLDVTRAIALRGTIIMFLGDVFAYRVSKLIEIESEQGGAWQSMYNDDDTPPESSGEVRYNGADLSARSMECYEQSYYMACDVTDHIDPYRISCLARIGQLHSLCRRWDLALPILQRCLEQSKDLPVIHRQLRAGISVAVADVLRHGADSQQHEAITLYTSALQLYHDSAGANCAEMGASYLGIGRIWTSRGDYNSALRVSFFLL